MAMVVLTEMWLKESLSSKYLEHDVFLRSFGMVKAAAIDRCYWLVTYLGCLFSSSIDRATFRWGYIPHKSIALRSDLSHQLPDDNWCDY